GESFILETRTDPDDRVRVACLLDGLRRAALLKTGGCKGDDDNSDTIRVVCQWQDLNLEAVTAHRQGLVLSDEVTVQVQDRDHNRHWTWRVINSSLIEPPLDQNPQLMILIEALLRCGFDLTGSRRIGWNIWQETLSFKS
ncbi:MAG: hypothetical protein V2A61_06385, partial [Calditrichota bacterium]